MSKITNLIGTTWRLDGPYDGINAESVVYNVDFQYLATEELEGESFSVVGNGTAIMLGYSLMDFAPIPENNSVCCSGSFDTVVNGQAVLQSNYVYALNTNVTFTGGEDISNPLFIDFINTYGTLVSGGEPPTAEGVKSKLQSLLTASNAKTGKSDANLTDAVKTLLEGFGSGEGIFAEEENEHGTTIVLGADLQEKTIDITANGTVEVTPDEGYALKKITAKVNVGGDEWINDGNTHIWISLAEGRTAPVLSIYGPQNAVVTVDWGDGTEPDALTCAGLYTMATTPPHNYVSAGDYVITLITDADMTFERPNNSGGFLIDYFNDKRNYTYRNRIQKVEFGNGISTIGTNCLVNCYGLANIIIPNCVTRIAGYSFKECYSLGNILIPNGVTNIDQYAFSNCYGLSKIRFEAETPPSAQSINAFHNLPADCIISVPVGTLEAYTTATNYPSATTYTYVEE